jgi:biofilm PGA synthesis N-glycosyltransferase PgaC
MDLFAWVLLSSTVLYAISALAFLIGLHLPDSSGGSPTRPFVSVVIAARNEADYIGECLKRLTDQTYPTDLYEILVVDDNSSDATTDIVKQYADEHPGVTSLVVGGCFPEMSAKKRPLSVGIHRAKGEIILTTDADCRVPRQWVEGMAKYFKADVGTVIGFSQIKQSGSALGIFEKFQGLDFLTLMSASAGSAKLGIPLAATGQNLAYRKSLFESVGGFNSIADRPSGDDVLLLQLLKKGGQRIQFAGDPDTFVGTWRTESPTGFWQQRRRWASNAFTQLRLNPLFFTYTLVVFLVNLLLPLTLALGISQGTYGMPLACLTLKIACDFLVVFKGSRLFARRDLMSLFPIWEILQPPYIVFVALASLFTGFTWKGRRHR